MVSSHLPTGLEEVGELCPQLDCEGTRSGVRSRAREAGGRAPVSLQELSRANPYPVSGEADLESGLGLGLAGRRAGRSIPRYTQTFDLAGPPACHIGGYKGRATAMGREKAT